MDKQPSEAANKWLSEWMAAHGLPGVKHMRRADTVAAMNAYAAERVDALWTDVLHEVDAAAETERAYIGEIDAASYAASGLEDLADRLRVRRDRALLSEVTQ